MWKVEDAVRFFATMEYVVHCEEVTDIGDRRASDGGCWTLELADALAGAGRYAFYMVAEGERIDLEVDAQADGELFLRPARGVSRRRYARSVSPR